NVTLHGRQALACGGGGSRPRPVQGWRTSHSRRDCWTPTCGRDGAFIHLASAIRRTYSRSSRHRKPPFAIPPRSAHTARTGIQRPCCRRMVRRLRACGTSTVTAHKSKRGAADRNESEEGHRRIHQLRLYGNKRKP